MKKRPLEEQKILDLTHKCITEKDWKDIIKRAVLQAKRGSEDARGFLVTILFMNSFNEDFGCEHEHGDDDDSADFWKRGGENGSGTG